MEDFQPKQKLEFVLTVETEAELEDQEVDELGQAVAMGLKMLLDPTLADEFKAKSKFLMQARVTPAGEEEYRPKVKVEKIKNGVPTVIKVDGEKYILQHKDQWRGGGAKTVKKIRKKKLNRNRQVTMTVAEIEKMKLNATSRAVKIMGLFPLMVLRDKFGFGQKRLERFIEEYERLLTAHHNGYIELEDIANTIYEETGIDRRRVD